MLTILTTILLLCSPLHLPCSSHRVSIKSFGPFSSADLVTFPLRRGPAIASEAVTRNIKLGELLATKFPSIDLRETTRHQTRHNRITHIYLKQYLGNTSIENTFVQVNLDQSFNVVSHSFQVAQVPVTDNIEQLLQESLPQDALRIAADTLGLSYPRDMKLIKVNNTLKYRGFSKKSKDRVEIFPCYFLLKDAAKESVRPTWQISWRRPAKFNFLSNLDIESKKIYLMNDRMNSLSYRAIPLGKVNASDLTILNNPEDSSASPNGWINGLVTTVGNNVQAQENWDPTTTTSKYRPNGTIDLVFDWNPNLSPKENANVSITNLFVWINLMHDLTYHYGFTEAAGNFQLENFGKGGKGKDPIIAYAQDTTGEDDAYFETSPDGELVYLSVFLFKNGTRDGALSTDVIAHEFMHGVSTRLTGGSQSPSCLPWGEPLGMGEGWSDFVAVLLQMDGYDNSSKQVGIAVGVNGGKTIRKHMYSTDMKVNPTTYGWLNQKEWGQSPHNIGEIWANVLYQMYWNIMAAMKFRFNANWYSADPRSGNTWTLQLVIDGLKLQPCQPTFVSARDAILEADRLGSKGRLRCPIWAAFAKRGVGVKAQSVWTKGIADIKEDFTLPSDCPQ